MGWDGMGLKGKVTKEPQNPQQLQPKAPKTIQKTNIGTRRAIDYAGNCALFLQDIAEFGPTSVSMVVWTEFNDQFLNLQ